MEIAGLSRIGGRLCRWLPGAAVLVLLPGVATLSTVPAQAGQAVRLTAGRSVPSAGGQKQLGSAVAITPGLAFVSAPNWNHQTGIVYVYTRHGTAFSRQSAITGPLGPQAAFGTDIAVSGRTMAVIANHEVLVFHHQGTKWQPQATLASQAATSVALSGSTLVVGAADYPRGSATIYGLSRGSWRPQKVIHDPRGPGVNWFGGPVAISGSTVVVGGVGVAVVYARSGSRWIRQATLMGHAGNNSFFGQGLGISGSSLVVGAWDAFHRNKGIAYFYQRTGRAWKMVARFRDPNTAQYTAFGYTVAISGDRALVGAPSPFAPSAQTRCGSVYEFVRSGGTWHYRAKVVNPGCRKGDEFGEAIAMLGRTALIGAPAKNHNQGAVFKLTIP